MKFLRKFFFPFSLVIFIALLFYTYYKSEIYWNGTKDNYYLVYYIVIIISIIFLFISFFLNNRIKDYLIISIISIFICLYFCEGYLVFLKNNKEENFKKEFVVKKKIFKETTGHKYDIRSKYEIYEDLKKIDKDIKLSISPNIFINEKYKLYPLSGISNSKTIHCNENGYYSIYQSDRYGFNNPDIEWDQKEIEYLLVGDSFTHGACVNRPNDIASVLRLLSNKSALNLGFSSNGPLIEYATLREYLGSNVKKVLWIYYSNDIDNLVNELTNEELKKYIEDLNHTQKLKFFQKDLDNIGNTIVERYYHLYKKKKPVIYFLKLNQVRIILNKYLPLKFQSNPILTSQPQTKLEFKKIIKMAKDLTSANSSQLYFIYIPGYYNYSQNFEDMNYLFLKKVTKELNIPFIDIHQEVLVNEKNPLELFPFGFFGHYNEEGYKKIAEGIFYATQN